MRKKHRDFRPASDEPLSEGRVEYLEQARARVRNRRIRRTALIVAALTLVVLFATGFVGSSVAMAKDWADTARILLFPGTGWPQQTGVMEVEQLAALNGSFVELGEEGCVVWSRTGTRLNAIQSGYARPALAAGKNRFVLYNRSGNELRVESRTQNLYTKTMENSITLCAMADNGTLAVVTEDPGSAARLRIYSSSMEEQLSWSLTTTDGTPLRMAFSPDGRRLAVAAVTVSGGQMVTNFYIVTLAQGDPRPCGQRQRRGPVAELAQRPECTGPLRQPRRPLQRIGRRKSCLRLHRPDPPGHLGGCLGQCRPAAGLRPALSGGDAGP